MIATEQGEGCERVLNSVPDEILSSEGGDSEQGHSTSTGHYVTPEERPAQSRSTSGRTAIPQKAPFFYTPTCHCRDLAEGPAPLGGMADGRR